MRRGDGRAELDMRQKCFPWPPLSSHLIDCSIRRLQVVLGPPYHYSKQREWRVTAMERAAAERSRRHK